MIRRLAVLLTVILGSLGLAAPATAYAPVTIVHTEQVTVGPYRITVGFSTWPIRAMRSLDFTFTPADGIAGKSGTVAILRSAFLPPEAAPGSDPAATGAGPRRRMVGERLVRHPRKREVWGLDVEAVNNPGTYALRFAIDGPKGYAEGTLPDVTVLDQPGPPMALSWAIGTLPLWALIALIAIAWRRVRPGRRPLFA
ncbi:MAG TPA: hypothetical protein VGB74_15750 [Actinoplanes sp.]|jgi:hypothetical protein